MVVRNFFPIFYLIISLIVGCAKPFQPPPAAVDAWIKSGAERQEVLRQLLDCGYPDAVGFVGINGRDVKLIDRIRAEQCMFGKGFKYKSGWGGTCSLRGDYIQAACEELKYKPVYSD